MKIRFALTLLLQSHLAVAQQPLGSVPALQKLQTLQPTQPGQTVQPMQGLQPVGILVAPPKPASGNAKVTLVNTDIFPHIVFVQIYNKGARLKAVAEVSATVKPYETLKLDVKPLVENTVFESGLQWVTYQDIGDIGPAIKDNHFQIPFPPQTKIRVCQSADGPQTTHGKDKVDAIDFCAPEKTPITAAKDGIVTEVVQHFTEGGLKPELLMKANTIHILHRDGLMSVYSHIYPNSALVKVGQRVTQGQPIALEGNVGYSSGAHLHFEVLEGETKLNDQKNLFHLVPIHFFNKNNTPIKIKHDLYYSVDGEACWGTLPSGRRCRVNVEESMMGMH